MKKLINKKHSRPIFLLLLFLLILIYYFRKIGEEGIFPSFDNASQKNFVEETPFKNLTGSNTSHESPDFHKSLSHEETPDPFADLEPSTPVLALLYGKVTDNDGKPLPDARVSVYSGESGNSGLELLSFSFTDEQGMYCFTTLPLDHFQVWATKPGYYLEYKQVYFSLWRRSVEQNFEMSRGGLSLAGIVQNKQGTPITGASVILHLYESRLFLNQTTNSKGAFLFDGLCKEIAAITVTARGFTAFSQRPVMIGKEDMQIILSSEKGTKIKGMVLYNDTREPAPESTVIIESRIQKFFHYDTLFFMEKTDEWGVYETVSLPQGKYKFRASQDGCHEESSMAKEIQVLDGSGEEMWMDLMLPRMHDIRGCVIDAKSRQPIPGAVVQARSIPPEAVQTDSQGRFCIPDSRGSLFQGTMTLFAQAPGYMPGIQNITNISTQPPPVIIKMRKGVRIYGTISSSSFEPATNADWEIQKADLQIRKSRYSRHTDSQGKYEHVVAPEWMGEDVCLYGYSPTHGYGMEMFHIPEDGIDIKRDLTLSSGISVTVRVLDRNGEGIKNYEINVQNLGKGGIAVSYSIRTDFRGYAVFENLAPSLYEFTAYDPLFDPSKQNILNRTLDLVSETDSQEIFFYPDDPEEKIRVCYGSVMDNQQNPIKDVLVESFSLKKETLTDDEGYYRIEAIVKEEKREVDIFFSKTGYFIYRRAFNTGKEEDCLDIVMKKRETLKFFGTIKSPSAEIPTEAEIEIWRKNEGNYHWAMAFRRVSLMKGGIFEFNIDTFNNNNTGGAKSYTMDSGDNTMESGIYYYIKAQDYTHGSGRSQDIKAVGGDSIGPFEIVFSWGKLKGYLRDGITGNAVSNGLISSYELSSFNYNILDARKWGSGTYTFSDESGYFEISPLPPGCSKIYFYHPDYWIQERIAPEITRENPEVEWNPILDPCSSLEGRVVGANGTPLAWAGIYISNKSGFAASSETDDQGLYSFTGIPPGEYSISYNNSNYNCSISIKRENIIFSEPEQRLLDIHIPQLFPAVAQLINTGDIHSHQKSMILKPLYPVEYTCIDILLYGIDINHTYLMLVPQGRYLMQLGGNEGGAREIEIDPDGENLIIIDEVK